MIDEVLARLDGVRRGPSGAYTARCPAHEDRRPSLSITEGDDGRVLLHCHAGCTVEAIVTAMGLVMTDLFPRATDTAARTRSLTATYDYRDHGGELRYQVVRYADKRFSQRRPDGHGGFHYNLNGIRKLLYKLPELKGLDRIWIPEGEKDVDTLWRAELPATTNSGGAGKWHEDHTEQLVAIGVKHVIVLADNDLSGREHAIGVGTSCDRAGIRAKVVMLPGLKHKGDVSDFLAEHTKEELLAAVERCHDLRHQQSAHSGSLQLTNLDTVISEPIDWLWPGRLARGKATIICGNPGDGKSRLTFDIAARVTQGHPWPNGGVAAKGDVLMLVAEDGLADTVKPGIEAMHGDCKRVHVLEGISQGAYTRPPNLAQDIDAIREAIERTQAALIIIDPITAYLGGIDSYKDSDVRGILAPLLAVIAKCRSALLMVAHLNKDQQRAALYRVGGSIGFVAAVRTAFAVGVHPDQPTVRVMAQLKSNISAPVASLAYELSDGVVFWRAGTVDLDAESLFSKRGTAPSKIDKAEDYIQASLANGPIESDLLRDGASASGIAPATFFRARKALDIEARKLGGFGDKGKWYVALRNDDRLNALAKRLANRDDSGESNDDQLIDFDDVADSGPDSGITTKGDQAAGGAGQSDHDERD